MAVLDFLCYHLVRKYVQTTALEVISQANMTQIQIARLRNKTRLQTGSLYPLKFFPNWLRFYFWSVQGNKVGWWQRWVTFGNIEYDMQNWHNAGASEGSDAWSIHSPTEAVT